MKVAPVGAAAEASHRSRPEVVSETSAAAVDSVAVIEKLPEAAAQAAGEPERRTYRVESLKPAGELLGR